MKKLLITGTDTNVGKTWITCLLLRQLRSRGIRTGAYKPVCSGAEQQRDGSCSWVDVDRLVEALGVTTEHDRVCPQRFQAAVAPNVAARKEHRVVDDDRLRSGVAAWQERCDYLVIEGAGGLMCPLSDKSTVLDFAEALSVPILIVAANRLGVINHTLLTVAAAQNRDLVIAGIVLNDSDGQTVSDDPSADSNAAQLSQWLPDVPLFRCGFGGERLVRIGAPEQKVAATDLFAHRDSVV